MPNLILTGFMGTGKTTVGRLLSDLLDMEFVDTDALIESRHGPIPGIFLELGEVGFRDLERDIAGELAGTLAASPHLRPMVLFQGSTRRPVGVLSLDACSISRFRLGCEIAVQISTASTPLSEGCRKLRGETKRRVQSRPERLVDG